MHKRPVVPHRGLRDDEQLNQLVLRALRLNPQLADTTGVHANDGQFDAEPSTDAVPERVHGTVHWAFRLLQRGAHVAPQGCLS